MDEIVKDTSIDGFLDQDPANLTQPDYVSMAERLRAQRAQFIRKGEKRRAKRSGDPVEDDTQGNDDDKE